MFLNVYLQSNIVMEIGARLYQQHKQRSNVIEQTQKTQT